MRLSVHVTSSAGHESEREVTTCFRPLQESFVCAVPPDKFKNSPRTTLPRWVIILDGYFGQVSRALKDRATGPETSTLLLRLLNTPFDHVDIGAGCTRLHTLMFLTGAPFAIPVENFAW